MENEKISPTAPNISTQPVEKTSKLGNLFSGRKKFIFLGILFVLIILGFFFWYSNRSVNLSQEEVKFYEEMVKSDFTSAQNTAKQALNKSPDNAYFLAGIINAYASEGNQTGTESKTFEEAQPYVKQALGVHPNDVNVLISMGYLYETAGKYEEALSYYNKAIVQDPNNSMAYFHKGHVLQFLGNNEEAYKMYEKSLEIDPNNPSANLALAIKYREEKNDSNALKYYEKVYKNSETQRAIKAEAFTGVSVLLQSQGKLREALIASSEAVKLNPEYSLALAVNASNLYSNGQAAEAKKFIDTSINANPRITTNYLIAGDMAIGSGNYQKALDYYEKGLSAVGSDNTILNQQKKNGIKGAIYYNFARTYYLMGNDGKAIDYLSQAAELNKRLIDVAKNERRDKALFSRINLSFFANDSGSQRIQESIPVPDTPGYTYDPVTGEYSYECSNGSHFQWGELPGVDIPPCSGEDCLPPSPSSASCNQPCGNGGEASGDLSSGGGAACGSGLACTDISGKGKVCRLPSNPDSETCSPPSGSPTPTPTVTTSPTPTPTSAPTPTPTTIPACNVACERPGDCAGAKDGCTACIDKKCQVPPTPTPTLPPFSQDMCKCDGIELSPKEFGTGSKLTVTAYAKVEGENLLYAEVARILFTSGKGVDPNIKRDIPFEVPVDVNIVENTANKIRYKAVWDYTVPDYLDPKLTYRIWADPQCVRRGEAGKISSTSQGIEIIPETDTNLAQNKNTFWSIWNFFKGLFAGSSSKSSNTQTIQSENSSVASNGKDSLQLETIGFGEIAGTDSCRYIKIKAKK
jgi:tetratricopeptide (TPR) repeat protein